MVKAIGVRPMQKPIREKQFTATPNPAFNYVNVKFRLDKSQTIDLALFDMQGRKVQTLYNGMGKEGDNDIIFNMVDVSNGIYLVCMSQDGQITRNVELIKK